MRFVPLGFFSNLSVLERTTLELFQLNLGRASCPVRTHMTPLGIEALTPVKVPHQSPRFRRNNAVLLLVALDPSEIEGAHDRLRPVGSLLEKVPVEE